MKGSLPAARQAQTLNAVVATLSKCLDLDAGTLIPELRQAEEVRHRNAPTGANSEDQAVVEMDEQQEEEEEEGPKRKRNGKAVRVDNDFSDLLPVSGVCSYVLFKSSAVREIHQRHYAPCVPFQSKASFHSKSVPLCIEWHHFPLTH